MLLWLDAPVRGWNLRRKREYFWVFCGFVLYLYFVYGPTFKSFSAFTNFPGKKGTMSGYKFLNVIPRTSSEKTGAKSDLGASSKIQRISGWKLLFLGPFLCFAFFDENIHGKQI